MSEEALCDECGCTTESFESCELCGITLCGDCAIQFVDEKGKVVWHCESCHEEYQECERKDRST